MCNSIQSDLTDHKPALTERLAQAQGMTRNGFILSALGDAIKLIEQLNFEINAVSFYLDKERKQPK